MNYSGDKIYLAFLWHHHQPYYRDTATGEFWLPWVRLHGIKDYYGMAALLREFPDIKATINIVPSLLKQLQGYLDGGWDRGLYLGRKPVKDLADTDKRFLLDNLFMAHPKNMIGRYPRYNELFQKYQRLKAPGAIKDFTDQDFIDLVVLANLAWFHPILQERGGEPPRRCAPPNGGTGDGLIKGLIAKGRGFTEADKTAVLQKQMDVLAEIVPMHKQLQDSGQADITTTPFYHPILPLLCDVNSVQTAMPWVKMPVVNQAAFRVDAGWHVAEAVQLYKDCFGVAPRGMWPAEGSVSPDILPLLAQNDIRFFATDEEILAQTLGISFHRDGQGVLTNPEPLYQPYSINTSGDKRLNVVFRDKSFSNLVSFQYQGWDQADAARHLVNQVKANAGRAGSGPKLVTVILDGENPWEYYPNNGITFIRTLYQLLSEDKGIETVRLSDYLERFPPKAELKTIYPGSWINHNFAIWAGDEEDRRGWEYLNNAREAVVNSEGKVAKEVIDRAMENIHIAEGSDWFWWFGPEHSSPQDNVFDALFRKNLLNVYRLLGLEAPEYLYRPIKHKRAVELHTEPWGNLEIKLDGRVSDYFEWLAAGHYTPATDPARGTTMDSSAGGNLRQEVKGIYFGFNKENIFIRIDVREPAEPKSGVYFAINFLKPLKRTVIIPELLGTVSSFTLYNERKDVIRENVPGVRYDSILEIACPLGLLGFKAGDEIEFLVELLKDGKTLATYPGAMPIKLRLPQESLENISWMV